jgi:hypothetical protein
VAAIAGSKEEDEVGVHREHRGREEQRRLKMRDAADRIIEDHQATSPLDSSSAEPIRATIPFRIIHAGLKCRKNADSELEKFRKRPLSESFRYVFLDAQYQQVRHAGAVRSLAVLLAIGVNSEGKREILGVSVSLSEAEVHWREFLQSLVARGLSGMELVISDDHSGLKAARQAVLPSVPWQRCQFHMSQNAQAYVPTVSMRQEIAQAMRDIFSQPGVEEAREMAKKVIKRYEKKAPGSHPIPERGKLSEAHYRSITGDKRGVGDRKIQYRDCGYRVKEEKRGEPWIRPDSRIYRKIFA